MAACDSPDLPSGWKRPDQFADALAQIDATGAMLFVCADCNLVRSRRPVFSHDAIARCASAPATRLWRLLLLRPLAPPRPDSHRSRHPSRGRPFVPTPLRSTSAQLAPARHTPTRRLVAIEQRGQRFEACASTSGIRPGRLRVGSHPSTRFRLSEGAQHACARLSTVLR